jgi:hypothetical protein
VWETRALPLARARPVSHEQRCALELLPEASQLRWRCVRELHPVRAIATGFWCGGGSSRVSQCQLQDGVSASRFREHDALAGISGKASGAKLEATRSTGAARRPCHVKRRPDNWNGYRHLIQGLPSLCWLWQQTRWRLLGGEDSAPMETTLETCIAACTSSIQLEHT